MDGGEQSKSEEATPHKLKKAREQGQVSRGLDLGFLTSLAAFCAFAWFAGASTRGRIAEASRDLLIAAPGVLASPSALLEVAGLALSAVARPLIWMGAVIFLAVLVLELIQTGVVFTTAPLRFDFNRLNPAEGIKRVFTVRLLLETLKGVLKLAAYGGVTALVIAGARRLGPAVIHDGRSLAEAMTHTGLKLLACFVGVAVVFALLDQLISRRAFAKRMRMSRRDVRREHRDREGDPRLKQRRRQLHREFVQLSESLRNVRGADLLITNPTHFAVALRYDPRTMVAPRVVSLGVNQSALRLRRLAFVYGVVIVENPPLARALFRCRLNQEIPEAYFRAVAGIYTEIRDRRQLSKAVVHVR